MRQPADTHLALGRATVEPSAQRKHKAFDGRARIFAVQPVTRCIRCLPKPALRRQRGQGDPGPDEAVVMGRAGTGSSKTLDRRRVESIDYPLS